MKTMEGCDEKVMRKVDTCLLLEVILLDDEKV